ncbi:MAG: NAD(P)-dependent oxidoreductase [Patescibacteria group bacterium]
MRIFVTGGTGFIGRSVVAELIARKHEVLVLTERSEHVEGVSVLQGTLTHVEPWEDSLKRFAPEAVIHLAWEGIPDFSYTQCSKNLQYGINLLNVIAGTDCARIVATGTGFECGTLVGKIDDDVMVPPFTPFTAAKHALHLLGIELAKEKKIDFVWLRPYNPYGGGQRSGSLIPYIMRTVAEGVPLQLKNPIAQGDFIYIADVARVFVDAVEKGKGIATYNVGSGYLTPVREIARLVCEIMGKGGAYYDNFKETAQGDLQNAAYADLTKVKRDLGWQPLVSIKEGLQKTITDYENTNHRV